jgi:hypothetical protein
MAGLSLTQILRLKIESVRLSVFPTRNGLLLNAAFGRFCADHGLGRPVVGSGNKMTSNLRQNDDESSSFFEKK